MTLYRCRYSIMFTNATSILIIGNLCQACHCHNAAAHPCCNHIICCCSSDSHCSTDAPRQYVLASHNRHGNRLPKSEPLCGSLGAAAHHPAAQQSSVFLATATGNLVVRKQKKTLQFSLTLCTQAHAFANLFSEGQQSMNSAHWTVATQMLTSLLLFRLLLLSFTTP